MTDDAALIALVTTVKGDIAEMKGAVKDDIGKLDKKLDEKTSELGDRIGKVVDDHEQRIRKLERWQYIATGLAAAIGSGVGASAASLLGH